MIGCAAEQYKNPENGEYEYHSVVFRLCPSDSCDDQSTTGCASGHGDYVVGINTFVDAWLEGKRDDMENDQDDQWDLNQFSECREYEVDQDADEEQDGEDGEEKAYYVGPTCSNGQIAIGFFSEYTCTTVPSDVTFEDISNGWSLPYSNGGLVTNYCESCSGYNDNGEEEISQMCQELWTSASSKCESGMANYSQVYGKDESGCEYIASSFPVTASKSSSKAGAIVLWVFLALLIVGGAFFAYTKWWMKRKQGTAAGLSTADGVTA